MLCMGKPSFLEVMDVVGKKRKWMKMILVLVEEKYLKEILPSQKEIYLKKMIWYGLGYSVGVMYAHICTDQNEIYHLKIKWKKKCPIQMLESTHKHVAINQGHTTNKSKLIDQRKKNDN